LEEGLIYTEAVLLANIPEVIGKKLFEDNRQLLIKHISGIIEKNRKQKTILNIVNNLISQHKNLEQKFGYKDSQYELQESDRKDRQKTMKENIPTKKWEKKE